MIYILNPRAGSVSVHSATSTRIATHADQLYAAVGGLVQLDPTADVWAELDLQLGELDLGGGELVGLPWLEIEVGATQPLTLTLTAVREKLPPQIVTYTIPADSAEPRWYHVELQRMMKGHRWSMQLTGQGPIQVNQLLLAVRLAKR